MLPQVRSDEHTMSKLWLKLFRDLRSYRVQAIGIAVTMMLGIALFHGFYLSYLSIGASYERSYDDLRLADFTITLDRAPRQTIGRLETIPGIHRIDGRISRDIRVEQAPGRRQVVTGRVLSVPDEGYSEINQVVVLEGRHLGPPDRREVLLERGFAEAHDYRPGDIIYPVVNGVRTAYRVVGLVSSIEYLYVVRSKEHLFPTPESFGVMWMRRKQAERLFEMHGIISEVVCLTIEGERDRVMAAAYADLRRFGATPPLPAEEQPSRELLDLDHEQLGQFAVVFPGLFIVASALTVFSIAARTIDQERRQIGFLRASGLPAWRIGLQYIGFAAMMGLLGVIPGVLLGQAIGVLLVEVYLAILGIPHLIMGSGFMVALVGIAIAITASLVAGWRPSKAAAAMNPADAMRPQSADTARFKPPRFIARLQRGASFGIRIAISNLFRQGYRTLYTVVGVSLGVIMMIMSMSLRDSIRQSIAYYFSEVRNYDVDVGFDVPVSESLVEQVRQWPYVSWAEGSIGLPVTLHYAGESHDYTITGVPPGSRLQTFRDRDDRPVELEGFGLYPDTTSAQAMGVERGSMLRAEYAYSSREVQVEHPVRVTQAVRQPVGSGVYMSADALRQRFGARLGFPPGTIGGMVIKAEPGYHDAVIARAYDLPDAVSVEGTHDMRDMIDQALELQAVFIGVLVIFAGTLTAAIVYNTIDTNVRERRSEIATLRALGVRMKEISRSITVENMISAALGILIGTPLGAAASRGLMEMWETEMMSIDFHVSPLTYVVSIVFTLGLVVLSQIPALRMIARMNLSRMTRMHGE